IYLVSGGVILTPPHTAGILDGISRRSVMTIAGDLGYSVVERNLARSELYLADEVFLSGTAAELVPVREIDDHVIGAGEPGPITREIQRVFDDALHGRDPRYLEWLDIVQVPAQPTPVAGSGPACARGHRTHHDRDRALRHDPAGP